MAAFDVIVVGGGIIGSAAAYSLAKRDLRVLLVDQDEVPNQQASSADHARIFHLTFGKDSFYTDLAVKTLPLWKQFQQLTGEELLLQTGMLDFAMGDGRYEEQSFQALQQMKIPVRKLKSLEVSAQYRMIRSRAIRFAVFHPDGGLVWAQKAITAFAAAARKRKATLGTGVKIVRLVKGKDGLQGLKDSKGKVWTADHYVFAAGPWTRELLTDFGLPLTLTRQESLYFRPPHNQGRYRPAHFPVFASSAKGFFGFPVHIHGFMRLGTLRKGPVNRSVSAQLTPDKGFERKCRAFMKHLVPDLADFTDMEGKACYYTRTPDGDPILGKLPGTSNAWVASGFSGQGPSFAPLVGEIMAQLVNKEKVDVNLHRFRAERFRSK